MSKPRRQPRRRVDGVVLLDKPTGMTSNAALQKVRWLLNAAKGGHTGTLDPLATGLLPLCLGEATKFSSELLDADKTYRAQLCLGIVTTTADAEGAILETRPVEVGADEVKAILPAFLGQQQQVPPMYSALKRDGVPLYELARRGIEVERVPRDICIHAIEYLGGEAPLFDIEVSCSKGTYIRTLVADIGAALGCGAHLTALRRTRVGGLDLANAVTIEQIEAMPQNERDSVLMPADSLLAELPIVELDDIAANCIRHGQAVRMDGLPASRCRLYAAQSFIGVGIYADDGRLLPQRLVASSST